MEPRSSDLLLRLRDDLAGFTAPAVLDVIGPLGQSRLERGDHDGVAVVLDDRRDGIALLVKLFLLRQAMPERLFVDALSASVLERLRRAGLVRQRAGIVDAAVEVRPYGELGGPDWLVVSDFGSDVTGRPVRADHVLGIGGASLQLAGVTVRHQIETAVDIGTGSGVQALHLARHAGAVLATDVSARALRLAALTAGLSGQRWQLAAGSLYEPLRGRRFDQIVANPPFVVSPGWSSGDGGHDYRDSGLPGDELCRRLVTGLTAHLTPGGTGQLLANWVIDGETSWEERIATWLHGCECRAWVWQREVAEPGEYVSLWLRDAGLRPGTAQWRDRYRRWTDWFAKAGIAAVGLGVVTVRRTDQALDLICDDVPQAISQPTGTDVDRWFATRGVLDAMPDEGLWQLRPVAAADCELVTVAPVRGEDGARLAVRLGSGLRWEIECDETLARVVSACDGSTPLDLLATLAALRANAAESEVRAALGPVMRDLMQRGFLRLEAA
ncbi:MAG: class I SAM-dependent methyltransferase [Actinobacteria bacterium]|nr:class I SAM-dependent methyltransferase [Actinomycetota bacterium]